MEVILLKKYEGLGFTGDIVKVKDGFARNYLVKNGIAVPNNTRKAKEYAHLKRQVEAKIAKEKLIAEDLKSKIEDQEFELRLNVSEKGKVFGSITSKDIEAALNKAGYEISKKLINLLEPIKKIGKTEVSVKLHSEVQANILFNIVGQQSKKIKAVKKKEDQEEVTDTESKVDSDQENVENLEDSTTPNE